jgi:hypothetical protein
VTPLPLGAGALAAYAGTYENPGELLHTLRVGDAGLELTLQWNDPWIESLRPALPSAPPLRLALATPDEAYAVDAPALRMPFRRGAGGRIEGYFFSGRFNRRVA